MWPCCIARPGTSVHDEHGSVWFLTGRDEPHANGILRAALPSEGLSDEVERRLSPFRHRRVPMMWWFFTGLDGVPAAVHAELRRAGLRPTSDLPGMVLDLSAFQAPGLPAGVTIQRVGDAPSFDAWADVVGRAFDDPSFASGGSVQAFRSLGWGEDAPFRHYLARLDGAWVGASTLSRAADVAGLANISAVPEARGRGSRVRRRGRGTHRGPCDGVGGRGPVRGAHRADPSTAGSGSERSGGTSRTRADPDDERGSGRTGPRCP